MSVANSLILDLKTDRDIVRTRQTVRTLTQELNFSLVDQTKMVTAASELARNTVTHGGGGTVRCECLLEGIKQGLRLAFEDHGPGIRDLTLAMTDGWTSGTGLGLGLSGSKRLVNQFEIETKPGHGTRVIITRWK